VEHFLYFPAEAAAREIVTPEAITSQRRELTELAKANGGEYDGWGAPQ
jgi:regulator of RNase E activity RraB